VVTPPYLDFDDIFSLENLLGGMIASSCDDQDAGGAGTCRPICRQVFW